MRSFGLAALGVLFLIALVGWWISPFSAPPRHPLDLSIPRQLIAQGRFQQARDLLVAFQPPDPRDPDGEAAFLLGVCEHELGRPEKSLELWSMVPSRSPRADQANLARAQTLVSEYGRFAEAESLLQKAANGDGDAATQARHALSQLYFYEGRLSELREWIEAGWNRLPDRVSELRDHWRTDHVNPDPEAIHEAVEPASQKAPDDDRVWLAQAYLNTLEGNFDKANRLLNKCLTRRPEDRAVWEAILRNARRAADLTQIETALKHLKPGSHEALEARAWVAEQQGDWERASTFLQQALQNGPADPEIVGRLVALQQRLGHKTDALRNQLREIQQADVAYRDLIDSDHPEANATELSRLAERLGRNFEALGWTTLALERDPADRELIRRLQRIETKTPRSDQGGPGREPNVDATGKLD